MVRQVRPFFLDRILQLHVDLEMVELLSDHLHHTYHHGVKAFAGGKVVEKETSVSFLSSEGEKTLYNSNCGTH